LFFFSWILIPSGNSLTFVSSSEDNLDRREISVNFLPTAVRTGRYLT
jgi:hypothetical protein